MSVLPKYNPTRKMTIEEPIEFDKQSEKRFAYLEGELFAMAGGNPNHSRVSGNGFALLRD
jgi:Uma2 family endonuclease